MLNVIFWLCGFLRMGVTGLTAEAFGANSPKNCSLILSRALALSLIIGFLALILRQPLATLLLEVIAPGAETASLAAGYFKICIWGAPALLVTLSVNGWFIGMQNTTFPMVISIGINIINIICSLSAVFLLRLGFYGVAAGTLIANWAGMMLALIFLVRFMRKHNISIVIKGMLKSGGLGKFFNVSGDLFLRSACLMTVSMGMTSLGARIGDDTLAVNTVAMQFFMFFSYFVDGFAFSGEALCGKFAGASDKASLWRAVREILLISGVISLIFTGIYGVAGDALAGLLTDVNSVRTGISRLHLILTLLPVISVAAFIFDGFYIGMTATRRMLFTTFAAMAVFFAIDALFHGHSAQERNEILWIAFLSYLFVRGAGLAIQMKSMVRRRFNVKRA